MGRPPWEARRGVAPLNKYVALCTAALAILSSAAVAGADGDHEEVQSFEVDGTTYYIHDSGLYEETNGIEHLQLEGGMASQPFDADEKVSPTLGP